MTARSPNVRRCINVQPGWLPARPEPGRPRSQIFDKAGICTFGVSGVPVLGRVQAPVSELALVSNLARCGPASSPARKMGPVSSVLARQGS